MGELKGSLHDEHMSDNRDNIKCLQCRGCIFISNSDVYSNRFYKLHCMVYKYPETKPIGIVRGEEQCEFKVVEGD